MPRKSAAEALKTPLPTTTPDPRPTNPKTAVRRCCAAWKRAFDAHVTEHDNKAWAARPAAEAYCNAMPMLSGYEGVRDFIACAAHGILINAIPQDRTSQLLYAAQVALAALRHAPKTASLPVRSKTQPTPLPLQVSSFGELFPKVTITESTS
jgi:hypothetical protein